jgi:serine phosphatase RsbU (regulator of sigma subunit)
MKFTIARKIGFGFAAVLITTLVVFFITYDTLRTGRSINDKINEQYNPSISALEQLKSTVLRSRTSITAWAFHQSREDTKEKLVLVQMVNEDFPSIKFGIDTLSVNWSEGERRRKERIYKLLNELLDMYSVVQTTLKDMRSYEDAQARFEMNDYVEEDGLIYEKSAEVIEALNELIADQRSNTTNDSIEMIKAFNTLESYLRYMSVILFIFGVVIATITVRSIVKPVLKLREILLSLSKGIIPEHAEVNTGDEIGEMSKALDLLVLGLRRTTEFSREVGYGNFEIDYQPLSDDDVLGKALMSMRDGLRESELQKLENERILEEKVEERTKEVVKQKNKIEKQNQQRKELLDNITASIRYAKSLQDAILPSDQYINSLLPENFIFFKPKDIVSGDFYYLAQRKDKILFAAVDCTGHGVPGAFMSLVGHNALSRAVSESQDFDPASMLVSLSKYAAKALNRTAGSISGRDGMDIALCIYEPTTGTMQYAGAFCPLYIVRNSEMIVYQPDKIVIGSVEQSDKMFETKTIQLEHGDMIYIFSDGYADQFGGNQGRKLMRATFREMLRTIATKPCSEQHEFLGANLETWRRGQQSVAEQVDDILVMGVRHLSSKR